MSDRAFAGADTLATAYALACAVRKLGGADIILMGRQAIDGDTGQVGPGVAENLGIAHVTDIRKIEEIADGRIVVERLLEEGYARIAARLPVVLTVVKEINTPRLPSLKGKLAAKKAEIPVLKAADIDADLERLGLNGSPTQVMKIFTPPKPSGGKKFTGEPSVTVGALLAELTAAGISIRKTGNKGKRSWIPIRVITQNCVGCKLCVKACPTTPSRSRGRSSRARRTEPPPSSTWGSARSAAPAWRRASATRPSSSPAGPSRARTSTKYSGICVFAEHRRGKLASVVPEIIGAARELQKELSAPVSAILVGNGVRAFTDELLSYGVDEVWMIDDPAIGDFDEDVQAELVSADPPGEEAGDLPRRRHGRGPLAPPARCGEDPHRASPRTAPSSPSIPRPSSSSRPARPSAATSWPRSSRRTTGRRWPRCGTRS